MKFSLTITDATKEEIAFFLTGASADAVKTLMSTVTPIPPATEMNGTTHMPGMTNPGDGYLAGITARSNADEDNAPTNTNAPAVDAAGLPHDVRIHSDNKGLNKDGTWRKRRGAQDATVAAVEAELKMRVGGAPQYQQNAQPQFTPPSNVLPMPSAPQYQQPQFTPPMPDQQFQPPQMMQPPGPQFTPPVQMQPPAAAMDFNAFMMHLGGQMQKRDPGGNPLINTDYLASIAQRLSAQFQRQFNSITDIANDPNAINCAVAFINGDGRWN